MGASTAAAVAAIVPPILVVPWVMVAEDHRNRDAHTSGCARSSDLETEIPLPTLPQAWPGPEPQPQPEAWP